MAYSAITSAEIAAGKPVCGPTGFGTKTKDNFDYLYGVVGSLSLNQVLNGSFEVDSDADGDPDNWTKNLYTGGTGTLYTTSPAHGAKSWSFVHPGGASNGGGYLDSDYIEVAELRAQLVCFTLWATAAGMKNMVQVRYFDKAKSELGAGSPATIFTSVANPATATIYEAPFTPLATTRYIKIRLIGGYTDTDVAGTIYFDNVRLVELQHYNAGDIVIAGGLVTTSYFSTSMSTSYVKAAEKKINFSGVLRIPFYIYVDAAGTGYGRIYRNGVAVGTERSSTDTTPGTAFTEDIAGWSAGDLVQLYIKHSAGTPNSVGMSGFSLNGDKYER